MIPLLLNKENSFQDYIEKKKNTLSPLLQHSESLLNKDSILIHCVLTTIALDMLQKVSQLPNNKNSHKCKT